MELEICQKRKTASFYITKLKYAVTEFVSKLTKLANPSLHILHPSLPARLSMIHNYLDVSMEYVVLQEYKHNHYVVTSNGKRYPCMFAFSCCLGTRNQRSLSMEKTTCTSPMITRKNPYYKLSNCKSNANHFTSPTRSTSMCLQSKCL